MALGIDISGVDDIDIALSPVDGPTALLQALARRLQTPAGSLFYDPNYGLDVRQWVHAGAMPVSRIEAAVEGELLKDERVSDARCSASFASGALQLQVAVTTDEDETYELTLGVNSDIVELL